jgi:hypothetical protein
LLPYRPGGFDKKTGRMKVQPELAGKNDLFSLPDE